MKLSPNQLMDLSKLANKAAQKAGEFINQKLSELLKNKQKIQVDSKNTGENLASQVVTQVDHDCQEIILETLKPSLHEFGLGLLTEESIDDQSRFKKDYFWCIDPLDGTLPFIEQTSGYAVSIALVSKEGIAVIGVVFDPTTQNLYSSVYKMGVCKNNSEWRPSQSDSSTVKHTPENILHFIHDRSFLKHPRYQEVLEQFNKLVKQGEFTRLKVIAHGGAVMNAIWTLENSPACYFKFSKTQEGGGSLWDYAATACIFRELGLLVSDMTGNALELNPLHSSFMNHCGILYTNQTRLQKIILSLA
jgi:3'-phosphoadenosine 5'-phosphosulfate (PAPS) 3'-phosphatase